MYIVKQGPYCPELKLVPKETQVLKKPKKVPAKMKMLPQTPVGMSITQTPAKFVPVNHKGKKKKF